jgi:tetratricopeptide (TPR) repeat protein
LLCNRRDLAAVTALFFAIHPLQVESVVWISGGSNLFSAAFFLGSLIAYLFYLRHADNKYLIITLSLFLLSVLSKAVAVVLPLVLLLIDYYKGRKFTAKVLLEKAPFILFSLGAGILTLILKSNAGAVQDMVSFSFPQRIVFASYGYVNYLLKLIFPLHLSSYYPYPAGGNVPIVYYGYLIAFIGVAAYFWFSGRFSKKIVFGLGFFTVTIFLLLQLLPVGGAIMADRYAYLPSVGIFYLAGEGFIQIWKKNQKSITAILVCAFAIFFTIKTYSRCGVWENEKTLWTNVISQYEDAPFTYYNRGRFYMSEKSNDLALKDFNKAIALKHDFSQAYYDRGRILIDKKRYDEALGDFNKLIDLRPGYAEAYNSRGVVYMNLSKFEEAVKDYTKAIELKPVYSDAYYNRGFAMMNLSRFGEAVEDLSKSIEMNAGYAEAYYNRAYSLMNLERYEEALDDFNKTLELKPGDADVLNSCGVIFYRQKNYGEAIRNYTKAIELNSNYAQAYFNRALAEYYSGQREAACLDLQKASSLGYSPAPETYSQLCR